MTSAIVGTLFSFLPASQALAVATTYVGEVITLGGTFCPVGFLALNGQLLRISEYETLFQLIGTRYGGDGVNNFALPVMPPTFAVNGHPVLFCIALNGIFPAPN